MRWLIAFVTVLGLAFAQGLQVRVLLADSLLASVKIKGTYSLWGWSGRITGGHDGSWTLLSSDKGIMLNGEYMGNLLSFVPKRGVFALNGRAYRGVLRVVWPGKSGGMLLINKLDLEDYLKGVVPAEVPSSFPFVVLKAQAILARTYLLSHLGSNPNYDICATQVCQVYQGVSIETKETNVAVEATRGMILAYGGRPILAVYSADSGGYTASAAEVWGHAVPYLVARPDPYAGRRSWTLSTQGVDIARALSTVGKGVGRVRSLSVAHYSQSGRIESVVVAGSSGRLELNPPLTARFLRALGLVGTRAHLSGSGPWHFAGEGSGHGVGMSQWGARGFAEHGWNTRQILSYYYPGTTPTTFELTGK